jgi:hypothetical protein
MSFLNIPQQIIFDRLTGNLGVGVSLFDTAPYLPEGAPSTSFPYVVMGNDTGVSWDTDDQLGAEITVTLHFWSRAEGFNQVKTIMQAAYDRLNRASLSKTGYTVVDCLHEFSEALNDPDGVTKHGIQRYRLTIQKGS